MKQNISFELADARLMSKEHKTSGEVKYVVRLNGVEHAFDLLTPIDSVNTETWKSLTCCEQEVEGPDGPFISRYAYLTGFSKYTEEVTVSIPTE